MNYPWDPKNKTLGLTTATWRTLQVGAMFALMACGGGGCGCGESCGVAPIPGGFPIAERIENSVQVRLTDNGIGFLEENIGTIVEGALPGGLEFAVPRTEQSFVGTLTICEDEDCVLRAEIIDAEITPTAGNALDLDISLRLQSYDTAGNRRGLPIDYWACNGNIDVDSDGGSRDFVPIVARLRLSEETQAARRGYTRIIVESAGLGDGGIENDDIRVSGCFLSGLLNLARGLIVGQIEDQVGGLLQSALDEQLCTTQGEYGCPTGTTANGAGPDAVCEYGDGTCVPTLLGTDGQGDLGEAFLGSISPGTHAPGQFLVAAGGDGEAVNDGMSVFMYGGFLGTTRDFQTTPVNNPCVPAMPAPPLPTVPRVATFRGNSVPGLATDPDMSIGVSESYLNHAGYGMYDSGLLCIGAGTNLAQQLSTGLFSALISSLADVAFPNSNAPISLALRPQNPPVFEIGEGTEEDPVLNISLPDLQIDFYVWSSERFIRFMTFESDLSIPIQLTAIDGEIVPSVLSIDAENSTVTNSELLREDPTVVANLVQTILTAAAGMVVGDLSGFALPDIMGLQLEVGEGGIRGIEEDGEEFLGIFANLSAAAPMALTAPVETRLEVAGVDLNRDGMQLETWAVGAIPSVTINLDADGPLGVDYEYSVRVDGRHWTQWSTESMVTIEDEIFLLQGRHEVEARARVVGERYSVDLTPAYEEILIDILEPTITLEAYDDETRVTARDVLTDQEDLMVRWQSELGAWSEWVALGREGLMIPSTTANVEVMDEAENVGSVSSALIRGRPVPGQAGCACTVAGADEEPRPGALFFGLALLGFVSIRRRRRNEVHAGRAGFPFARKFSFLTFLLPLTLIVAGCDCGDGMVPGDLDGSVPLEDGFVPGTDGAPDTGPGAPLEPGILATYLDLAADGDGSLYVAGYSPGVPPLLQYGDLVVGAYNSASGDMEWSIVDGAPSEPVFGDPTGWRDGVREAGQDVGRWASIVADSGTLHVTYQDSDEGDLKFASGTPGDTFGVHVVDSEGITGAYSDLIQTSGGLAVAYLAISPATTTPGRPSSSVRVATASGVPSGASDWSITDVYTAEIDCRAEYCPEGSVCTALGVCEMASSACGECGSGEECVAGGRCEEALEEGFVEDMPVAAGLHAQLAVTASGLGLVFYDRTTGNLWGTESSGGAWGAPFLIDGYARELSADPLDVAGDSGIGASLAVDGDTWHVTYVDGSEERLRYAQVVGGVVQVLETVDDGSTDGSALHTDGRHIVGDDSTVGVVGGEVRVAYQDATAGHAVLARRSGAGWTVEVLDDADTSGYWTSQVVVGTTSYIAHWWRDQVSTTNGVRIQVVD